MSFLKFAQSLFAAADVFARSMEPALRAAQQMAENINQVLEAVVPAVVKQIESFLCWAARIGADLMRSLALHEQARLRGERLAHDPSTTKELRRLCGRRLGSRGDFYVNEAVGFAWVALVENPWLELRDAASAGVDEVRRVYHLRRRSQNRPVTFVYLGFARELG